MGNTAQQCRSGLFRDSDLAGPWKLKINISWTLVHFAEVKLLRPRSWMCKKQTSVSHGSKEAERVFSGCWFTHGRNSRAWYFILDQTKSTNPKVRSYRETCRVSPHSTWKTKIQPSTSIWIWIMLIPFRLTWDLVALVLCKMYNDDSEAVIKMIIKGRSHTMRHVSRTHRVALDWLFDRINLDDKIQIRYMDTKHQVADILTKGN